MSEINKKDWGMIGAIGAGVAASACCTIPLALVSAGIGGSMVGTFTAMEPYRPYFIAIAVVALGMVGIREVKRSRDVDCDCEDGFSDTTRRSILGVGFLVTIAFIASPWIIRSGIDSEAAVAPDFTGTQQVVLTVEGMTCQLCDVTVSTALTNLDGVDQAIVTFEPPEAIVRYDPKKVSLSDMENATTEVGYPAKLKTETL